MKYSFLLLSLLFTQLITAQKNKTEKTTQPFSIGVIDQIQSKVLNEKRVLNIYLPQGYEGNDSVKYPVIYLLDGSADEDFIHVAGIVQFNNFPWVGQMPECIVVGIANIDRKRDFTFTTTIKEDLARFPTAGHSDKFISFIETELQPYIEKNYKVNQTRTIIGQSLGGLVATEILFKKPELFSQYIIISPSLWWDNGSLLNSNPKVLSDSTGHKASIYIGVGKEGLAPGNPPHVMEVDANLLAEKIQNAANKNLSVSFDYLPAENHATVTHQAVFNAFRILYAKK